jgi:predicted heme/steroid binding protein
MRRFTRQELIRFNGRHGAPAYIAYRGRVYDVTTSFLWRSGRHQARHDAGQDCTSFLKDAPHGPELLQRYPQVGYLEG